MGKPVRIQSFLIIDEDVLKEFRKFVKERGMLMNRFIGIAITERLRRLQEEEDAKSKG